MRLTTIAFVSICIIQTFSNFAIVIQSNSQSVDLFVSIFYRTLCASIIMLFANLLYKKDLKINKSEFKFSYIISICAMFFAPLCLYYASQKIDGGMMTICSSTSVFLSLTIKAVLENKKPPLKASINGIVGIVGVFVLFYHKIYTINAININYIIGILLNIIAIALYALSGLLSAINYKKNNTRIEKLMLYTFLVGTVHTFLLCIITKKHFTFDFSTKYILSFIFVVFFITILFVFLSIFLSIRIGQENTAYSNIICIILSSIISTIYFNWHWGFLEIIGIAIIIYSLIQRVPFFHKQNYHNKSVKQ